MTHEQMYKAVREKVIEAVPSIAKEQEVINQFLDNLDSLPIDPSEAFGRVPYMNRDIRLSDVLLAFKKKGWHLSVQQEGLLSDCDNKVMGTWLLTSDDLSQQSPETIKFLFDILCK